jgi:hypothetical protein
MSREAGGGSWGSYAVTGRAQVAERRAWQGRLEVSRGRITYLICMKTVAYMFFEKKSMNSDDIKTGTRVWPHILRQTR